MRQQATYLAAVLRQPTEQIAIIDIVRAFGLLVILGNEYGRVQRAALSDHSAGRRVASMVGPDDFVDCRSRPAVAEIQIGKNRRGAALRNILHGFHRSVESVRCRCGAHRGALGAWASSFHGGSLSATTEGGPSLVES